MKKPLTIDTESLESKNEKVQLYRHQVAGHYPIFWKSGVICKPIQKNELEFYQYISEHLKDIIPFVPRYLGVVTMNYGDLPPTPTELKTKDSAKTEFTSKQSSQTAEFNRFSSWGLRCQQKKKSALQRRVVKYIKLEDLTMPFSRPNILDLKIGSRVYGVGDDPDKVKRKILKSAQTTSKSLGLRLCGMQVYNSEDDGYVFRDKFNGRNLDEKGFYAAIEQFFTHKGTLRVTVVSSFLRQIEKLLQVVTEQKSFQFFSSSLLFICEGCRPSDQKNLHGGVKNKDFERIDLRFIDFAQSARDTEKKGVDEGFLMGLGNILSHLKTLEAKGKRHNAEAQKGGGGTEENATRNEENTARKRKLGAA